MFYLESPAGVGYSYGEEKTSDAQVGQDNLKAVIEFFKKFPEYLNTEFYISGESYAGTYIPYLAREIVNYNKGQTDPKNLIPLSGVMIGNGCTDPTECTIEAKRFPIHKAKFLFNHGFISQKLWNDILDNHDRCMFNEEQFCKDLYARVSQEVNGSQ